MEKTNIEEFKPKSKKITKNHKSYVSSLTPREIV